MHGLVWVALIAVVAFAVADSVHNEAMLVDEDTNFKVVLADRKGAKAFQRTQSPGEKQTFWVCDGTNKDKCGAWVDDKGKKLPGMSKTTIDKDNVLTIEKASFGDQATYYVLPKKSVSLDVHVNTKPRF